MRGNVVIGVNDFGNVLVAVVRVIRNGSAALPRERTRRHGLGRIPDEVVVVGSRSRRTEVRDLEIAVVDKPLVVLGHTTTHAVEGHRDDRITLRPAHQAVLAVVSDLPCSSRRLHTNLVTVGVVIISKGFRCSSSLRGDSGILTQVVGSLLRTPHSAHCTALAVADIVEVVAVAVGGIHCGGRIRKFAARVIEVVVGVGRVECRTGMSARNAAAGGIVSVDVFRNRAGNGSIVDFKEFVSVGPAGGEAIGVCERGFQVAARQIIPRKW